MSFNTKIATSKEWILLCANLTIVTFHNSGPNDVFIRVTETNTPPSERAGIVYVSNTGEKSKNVSELGTGAYIWVMALRGAARVIYNTENAPAVSLNVTGGSGGGASSGTVSVTQSVLPIGAARETTVATINEKLENLDVNVTSVPLPPDAATESTLADISDKLDDKERTITSSVLPTGAATETTLSVVSTKLDDIAKDSTLVEIDSSLDNLATEATVSAINTKLTGVAQDSTLDEISTKLDDKARTITSSVLPTGAATEATLSDVSTSLSQGVAVTGMPFEINDIFSEFPAAHWNIVTQASGDIFKIEGNTGGSSYLTVSLDPLTQDTKTLIESTESFNAPFDVIFGLHTSQRTVGQEMMISAISDEPRETVTPNITISSIQQATTTLTVNTATPHGLRVGRCIGITGVSDSRLNYPAVVVASTPSNTQFTVTAGPMGNITSLTAGPFASGSVYIRHAMDYATSGAAFVLENATVTNASLYSKIENISSVPLGGTLAGSHSITIATTASVQPVTTSLNYSFRPTSEYKFHFNLDRLQFTDVAVDSLAESTNRGLTTQFIPNLDKKYKLAIIASNHKSLSIPNARIVSATKSGSTTATVVTDVPHGLTTTDYVTIYGSRDQTNFPNITTATVVASVVNATTFTIVWGTASSTTSYGGFVSRANGGQIIQGVSAQVAQSTSRTNNLLTVIGSGTWAGFVVGDLVNIHGARTSTIDQGIDGAYRVRHMATTTLILEPLVEGNYADYTSTNIGGAVIKRTDLRLSYIKLHKYNKIRTEFAPKPTSDMAGSFPTIVRNATIAVTQSGSWTTTATGTIAEDAATTVNPIMVGGVVRTTPTVVTLAAGDAARNTMTTSGALVIQPYAPLEASWQYYGSITGTSMQAKGGTASLRNYVTSFQYQNVSATATEVRILDNSTVIAQYYAPANMTAPVAIQFPMPIKSTAANAINIYVVDAASTVLCAAQGFQAV